MLIGFLKTFHYLLQSITIYRGLDLAPKAWSSNRGILTGLRLRPAVPHQQDRFKPEQLSANCGQHYRTQVQIAANSGNYNRPQIGLQTCIKYTKKSILWPYLKSLIFRITRLEKLDF
jgi:hypothetical protein